MPCDHEIDAVLYAGYKYEECAKREKTPSIDYLAIIIPSLLCSALEIKVIVVSSLARFCAGIEGQTHSQGPRCPLRVEKSTWREAPNFRGMAS